MVRGARRSRFVVLLVALLLVPLVAVPPAAADPSEPGGTFRDDDGSVHEGFIEAIAVKNITRGCNPPRGDRFCPTRSVTREEMAAFLVRALGLTREGNARFRDVPRGSTFERDINRLAAAGITRGCNPPRNDRFCPERAVTREEMAAFLVRGFGLRSNGRGSFTDVPRNGTFTDDIRILAATGTTQGCNPPRNDRFCPKRPVTREQMASFLGRALGLRAQKPPPRVSSLHGNPNGSASIPAEGRPKDTSRPTRVIGKGTPSSCTSQAVVNAVARGGIIVFDCGPNPVTIKMNATAKIVNDTGPEIVIDGGGLVTLDGQGRHRILYMNTCDQAQKWTTSHCDDQDHPRLTVQNLTFQNGHIGGTSNSAGGGAIFARGGQLTVINSLFRSNTCHPTGPDVGGGAIRAFDQYNDRPVHVVHSTFGGSSSTRNECSNGGAISSIGVSWVLTNSLFTHNRAIGRGANPARSGTPGGGNGGSIALDGNRFTLRLRDTIVTDSIANEGGGAIFFVSNNRTGRLFIEDSTLRRNDSRGFETSGYPGIFYLGDGPPQVTRSTIAR